jgi:hypothetical protein
VLEKYFNALGQKISMDKSSIFFSKRHLEALREVIKDEIEFQMETSNEKYCGMPSNVG